MARPLAGRRNRGYLLGDPCRGRGGGGGALHIGHRFADDRCLWSEHPLGVHRRQVWALVYRTSRTSRTGRTGRTAPGMDLPSLSLLIPLSLSLLLSPQYRDIHHGSTPCGSPGCGCLLGDPQGVVRLGVGRCTSVTASRMADAYGASTPPRCPTVSSTE